MATPTPAPPPQGSRPTTKPVRERQVEVLRRLQEQLPDHPITAIRELNMALLKSREAGHLISPVDQVDYVPQMHAVSFRYVFLNPDDGSHDVYPRFASGPFPQWVDKHERALSQIGILKLWKQASGSAPVSRHIKTADPNHARVQVMVNLRGIDGRDNWTTKTKEVDLRPGSSQSAMMKDGQLLQQRQNIASLAETKAMLRAVRAAMALPQKMDVEAYLYPFIIPVLVPLLDTSDPMIRRLVAASALGIVGTIFGQQAANRALPPARFDDIPEGVDPDTGESVIDVDAVHDTESDDDDADNFPEPTAAPPPAAAAVSALPCTCPCGCTRPVKTGTANVISGNIGTVRCSLCYPWAKATFESAKHAVLPDLQIPKFPGPLSAIQR